MCWTEEVSVVECDSSGWMYSGGRGERIWVLFSWARLVHGIFEMSAMASVEDCHREIEIHHSCLRFVEHLRVG